MIFLFTDFGWLGPYVGQMKAVIAERVSTTPIIDLMHDAPKYNVKASAYLLAAISQNLPQESVIVSVIDPGVGSSRRAVALHADNRWFVGPDNGLLDVVANKAQSAEWFEITYVASRVSNSFHGRDIFAPVASKLFMKDPAESFLKPIKMLEVIHDSDDADEIIYIDHYGNLITGIRSDALRAGEHVYFYKRRLQQANTFSDVKPGEAFFYQNSQHLIEIAVNCGSARDYFNASIGDEVIIRD